MGTIRIVKRDKSGKIKSVRTVDSRTGRSVSSSSKSSNSNQSALNKARARLNVLKPGTLSYEMQVRQIAKLQGKKYSDTSYAKNQKSKTVQKRQLLQSTAFPVFGRGDTSKQTSKRQNIKRQLPQSTAFPVFGRGDTSKQTSKKQKPKSKTFYKGLDGKIRTKETGLEKRAKRIGARESELDDYLNIRFKERNIAKNKQKSEWNPKEIYKSIRRFPLRSLQGIYSLGMRVGLASEAVTKKGTRKLFTQGAKDTPKAVLSMFITKKEEGGYKITPSNILNIGLTALGVKQFQKGASARLALNKQLNKAKVTGAKVKVTKIKGNNLKVETKGDMVLPKVKVAGKTYKPQKVNFKETKILSKTSKPQEFKVNTINKYKVNKNTKIIKGRGKLATDVVKPIKGTTKGTKAVRRTSGTIKSKSGKTKFGSIQKGKKIVTTVKQKNKIRILNSKIKNLKNPNKTTTTFDLDITTSILKNKALSKRLVNSLKSLNKKINNKLSKNQIKNIKNNLNNLKKGIKKLPKIKGKKGQLAISKEQFKLKKQIPDNVDDIINNMNRKLKTISEKKISVKPKEIIKSKPKIITKPKNLKVRNIDPNSLLIGGRSLLNPKLIILTPIPLKTNLISSSGLITKNNVKVDGKNIIKEDSPINPDDVITSDDVIPIDDVIPTGDIITTSKTITNNYYGENPIFLPNIPNIISPRIIPGFGKILFGNPSGKGSIFTIPIENLPKNITYSYTADLFSKLFGKKASKKQRAKLLAKGRKFTGLERRRLV